MYKVYRMYRGVKVYVQSGCTSIGGGKFYEK